jgi:hypothetical protein
LPETVGINNIIVARRIASTVIYMPLLSGMPEAWLIYAHHKNFPEAAPRLDFPGSRDLYVNKSP